MTMGDELNIYFILLYFIYGLSFFCMGLTMALEAGRSPLLAEARILRPLAAFGLLHGMHEWMEIFMLYGERLGYSIPNFLIMFRLLLLAISFVSLAAYGIQVLQPPKRLAATDAYVGFFMLILYFALVTLTGNTPMNNPTAWAANADALSRYSLAIPGAILAGLALRHQAKHAQSKSGKNMAGSLRIAAWCFFIYGGAHIFVGPSEIFPASHINAELFEHSTGLPVQAIRAAMAVVATYSLVRATQIVDKQRQEQLLQAQKDRLAALEHVQHETLKRKQMRQELLRHTVLAQEEERARISRELHDETAQILSAAGLNMASLKNMLDGYPEAQELIDRSKTLCRQMSQSLYRLVHDLRPAQLDDLGLVPAMRHLADEEKRYRDMNVSLQISGERQRLDPLIETVLFRVVQEAITNVSRHADTKTAEVNLQFAPDKVILKVYDTGKGFDAGTIQSSPPGWGLAGMQERVESVSGELQIKSAPDAGTEVEVIIPLGKASGWLTVNTEKEISDGKDQRYASG